MSCSAEPHTNAHWSRLWDSGALHSCGHALEGNYDGPIARHWQQRFEHVRHNGMVVDLGTGNGALLLLARQVRPDLQLHGVDLARIDPATHCQTDAESYRQITFHGQCSMDQLPFAEHSIDLVVSQYGFEYGPAPGTLQEILRCLAPDGGLSLLLHGRDSGIWHNSRHQLSAAQAIEDSEAFPRALALAQLLLSIPSGLRHTLGNNQQAERCRTAFNQAASTLFDSDQHILQSSLFQQAVQCLSSSIKLAGSGDRQAVSILHNGQQRLHDQRARLQDFQRAVLDGHGLHALAGKLRAHGLQTTCTTLDYEGQHMGHCIDAYPRK